MDIYQLHMMEVLSYDIEYLLHMEDKDSWFSLLLYEKIHGFIRSKGK